MKPRMNNTWHVSPGPKQDRLSFFKPVTSQPFEWCFNRPPEYGTDWQSVRTYSEEFIMYPMWKTTQGLDGNLIYIITFYNVFLLYCRILLGSHFKNHIQSLWTDQWSTERLGAGHVGRQWPQTYIKTGPELPQCEYIHFHFISLPGED